MPKKELTFTSKLLMSLVVAEDILTPILNPYELRRRLRYGNHRSYLNTLYKFYKRGWIKYVNKDSQKFLQLTKKGQIEALLAKAWLPTPSVWDGKWRMVIFDIPEDNKDKRNILRLLLKKNKFHKLQNSVYINPYPLNREAVVYLKETGLDAFIRIIKVEEMDNEIDLLKKFKLKR